jgi:hypothetical protein
VLKDEWIGGIKQKTQIQNIKDQWKTTKIQRVSGRRIRNLKKGKKAQKDRTKTFRKKLKFLKLATRWNWSS